jgi:hypothetical protein
VSARISRRWRARRAPASERIQPIALLGREHLAQLLLDALVDHPDAGQ